MLLILGPDNTQFETETIGSMVGLHSVMSHLIIPKAEKQARG